MGASHGYSGILFSDDLLPVVNHFHRLLDLKWCDCSFLAIASVLANTLSLLQKLNIEPYVWYALLMLVRLDIDSRQSIDSQTPSTWRTSRSLSYMESHRLVLFSFIVYANLYGFNLFELTNLRVIFWLKNTVISVRILPQRFLELRWSSNAYVVIIDFCFHISCVRISWVRFCWNITPLIVCC